MFVFDLGLLNTFTCLHYLVFIEWVLRTVNSLFWVKIPANREAVSPLTRPASPYLCYYGFRDVLWVAEVDKVSRSIFDSLRK